jgi:protein-S-isoprenylcysteine O-methyltransferase Ste14
LRRRDKEFSVDRHQRQTQNRLIIAGFLILLGVGGGLVWVFYGSTAAVTAVACLLAAAGLFGLLWLILTLLELWVKEDEP